MKQKKEKEEGEHQVTISVTIAKASVTEHFNDGKKTDSPQVQNYLHCQYKLLPDDKDYVKTDIVTFGMAAKMYGDNDSKVLRTWIDGDKTWIAWTNSRKIRVTQELLLKMFDHKFELKMWDTKDKVSAKARFDRPKAFRLPQTKNHDEVDLEAIRSMLKQAGKETIHLGTGSSSLLSQSKGMMDEMKRAKKKVSFVGNHGTELDSRPKSSHQFINTVESTMEVKVRLDNTNQPEFKNLMSLASSGEQPLAVDTEEVDRVNNGKSDESTNYNDKQQSRDRTTKTNNIKQKSSSRSTSRQTDSRKSNGRSSTLQKLTASKQDFINQNGQACIAVPLSALFTNCLSISNTLEESVSTLDEVIVILSLDHPLLSDFQRFKLNPMVLTVRSAHHMPQNGLSYEQLKAKCHPPYVKYTFYCASSEHRSFAKEHGSTIRFDDNNVILLGTLNKQQLYEYLRGPALKIEVHDRDIKEVLKKKPSVFGTKPEDTNIFNTAYAGGTLSNLSKQNNSINYNYGVAEFDLSELLNGERILYHASPIRACKESQNVLHEISKSGVPLGDYLEMDSDLKIKIELVRSLMDPYIPMSGNTSSVTTLKEEDVVDGSGHALTPTTSSSDCQPKSKAVDITCPYSRLVYIFDYNNKEFLSKIFNLTTEINAQSLNFWSYPSHVIEAALSTYKLSEKEQADQSLDIITGCQIIDGEYHIFILEGLANKGVQRLWNELEHPEATETNFFRVLYNSSMTFRERLYVSLDVDLTRIRLHQPISNIVKQPFLYVRDMLPRNCFLAVTKLHELCQATSLQSVIRNETLPTVPMIVSLGREFGIPISDEDLHQPSSMLETNTLGSQDGRGGGDIDDNPNNEPDTQQHRSNHRQPLDMTNEAYEEILASRKLEQSSNPVDYINANIKSLVALSRSRARPDPPFKVTCDQQEVYHNYSTQTLNSTAMAMEKLRTKLTKEPDARCTFCQNYNSATVQPINTVQQAKMVATAAKEQWKTSDGFVYPGMKTTKEANKHPQRLDEARLSELAKPWRENTLHANILKPPVDRIIFKWIDRDLDFDTWKRTAPASSLMVAPPATIHTAGESLRVEQEEYQRAEFEKWKKRLVVDDTQFHSHRCLIATELLNKGPAASNQIARKDGLLKDEPRNLALGRRDLRLDPIPPTACVTVTDGREYDKKDHNVGFNPGDADGLSWSRDVNCIPINDYQHAVFENSKGHDFRLVHTDREKVGFKPSPLRKEEKNTHLFL